MLAQSTLKFFLAPNIVCPNENKDKLQWFAMLTRERVFSYYVFHMGLLQPKNMYFFIQVVSRELLEIELVLLITQNIL